MDSKTYKNKLMKNKKQHLIDMMKSDEELGLYDYGWRKGNVILPQEEPKQETLKEASEYFAHNNFNMHDTNNYKALKQGFEQGAKWQAERRYSEEDMIEFAVWMYLEVGQNSGKERTNKELFKEWFEQFKKK